MLAMKGSLKFLECSISVGVYNPLIEIYAVCRWVKGNTISVFVAMSVCFGIVRGVLLVLVVLLVYMFTV